MSRVLVVYASHFGQTREVAQRIVDRLRDRGHEVDIANATEGVEGIPPPSRYDAVLLGSRVEMGKHAKPILDYIRENTKALKRIPTAFFSVSMAASDKAPDSDPNHYLVKTFAALRWSPTESAAFGGALKYRDYSWPLRFIMKRISKREGHTVDASQNHFFTDYTAVVDFTDRFCWYLNERESVVHM